MEEHFVFPPDARAHDQSRRQKTALLQAEIRKAVKRSVVAGSSFDRQIRKSLAVLVYDNTVKILFVLVFCFWESTGGPELELL